jgi:hypothetical protein
MEPGFGNGELVYLSSFLLLCCCCLVVIAAGGGAGWYFYTRRNKAQPAPAAAASSAPTIIAKSTAAGSEVTMVARSAPEPEAPASFPGPASPIEPDDIRSVLLALNAPEKAYTLQATGYKVALVPNAGGGHLDISFDYAEKSARFVEVGGSVEAAFAQEARQALEAAGWTVKE